MPEPEKSSSIESPSSPRGGIPDIAVALLIFVGIIGILFALRPLADVPMNDDFSWARTAEVFARTGKIVYNGWGNPILLPHTIAGAIVIRLFGFSHVALGAFGIVSGAALAAVSYLLARACNASRALSLFLAALLTLNPVFLGVTPSFMSDIPSTFLFVASLLAFVRALEKTEGELTFRLRPVPLSVAAFLAFLAGANRQILWPALLLAFAFSWPAISAEDRTRRLVPALLVILIPGAALSLWFAKQPYAVPLNFDGLQFFLKNAPELAFFYPYKFFNMIGLFLLPVALPATLLALEQSKNPETGQAKRSPGMVLTASLAAGLIPLLIFFVLPLSARELWNGHWGLTAFGQYATYQGIEVGGVYGATARPAVISTEVALGLYLLGGIGIGLSLFVLLQRSRLTPLMNGIVNVLLIASVAQIILPLPWYASGAVFDRYLPALLPGLWIGLWAKGGMGKQEFRPYFFGIPFAVLYALAGFAFATEYFAYTQARAALYHGLLKQGIRPETIDAGVEITGDTQIAAEGYINNSGLKNPPDAFHPEKIGNSTYTPNAFPAIDAQYLLSTNPPPLDLAQLQARDALFADPEPIDKKEYSSPIGPKTHTIYVYRVHKAGETP